MRRFVLGIIAATLVATGALANVDAANRHGVISDDQVITLANDGLFGADTYAPGKRQDRMAQSGSGPVTTVQTSAPVTSTTVVKGGDLAAQIISWLQVAFGSTMGAAALWVFVRGLNYIGIKITDAQKAQLQGIVVNGLNAAAARAETQLRGNAALDINVKNQIVSDAITYTQSHGAEVIKALGLDPHSGSAVEAINARIQTALNDPATPTPPAITPATVMAAAAPSSGQPR